MIPLFQKIKSNTTLLTPNRRLAATLHKLYQHDQQQRGVTCWPSPDILPLSSWMQRLWLEEETQDYLLLSSIQEQLIWEHIIANTKESSTLLQITDTASTAISAWKLLKQWRIDLQHPAFQQTEDNKIFMHWALQFQTLCQEKKYRDSVSLLDFFCKKIPFNSPVHLILLGFSEMAPQWQHFFRLCEQSGHHIEYINDWHPHHSMPTEARRMSLNDAEDEIITMANWAKELLQSKPSASIGCVIPSLDKQRERVLQLFSECFAAEKTYTVDAATSVFNISAGKKLAHYPLIHAALQALSLHKKTISLDSFRYLLATPFLGEAESEHIQRAQVDILLRQKNSNTIDLTELTSKNEHAFLTKHCIHLAKRIHRFLSACELTPKIQTHYDWAVFFNEALTLLGWPGQRILNSHEYQTAEAWLRLLTEFQSLDQVAAPVTLSQALQTLHTMTSKNIFQPQTPEAPIQVLGTLEAAGIPFDSIWIAGFDSASWPPPPKPNPFIPKSLQRELMMPHATAERELIYCQQLMNQFIQSTTQIIFSHAKKNKELNMHASTLIESLTETTIAFPAYQSPSERVYAAKQIEYICDEHGPTLSAEEKILGGVSIIKQQALCPFKAFAEWRLHAHPLEDDFPGLRAKERGILLHRLLELIWNQLQGHTTLIQMSDADLIKLIDQCIAQLLPTLLAYQHRPAYMQLEHQRLKKLIYVWLQIEKERPPFRVLTHESNTQIQLGQLNLSTRIDRIDELENSKKLIIDYKTGRHQEINQWFGERPEEPQLPLYALHDAEQTIGISFAQITTGENIFKGVSHYTLEIEGIKNLSEIKKTNALSWQEQLTSWRMIFTQLSDDFYQGIAKVDPKNKNQTCSRCSLKPLCRVNETLDVPYES
jgi:probable DNA repair protein